MMEYGRTIFIFITINPHSDCNINDTHIRTIIWNGRRKCKMSKFKVGDKVKLVDDIQVDDSRSKIFVAFEMIKELENGGIINW